MEIQSSLSPKQSRNLSGKFNYIVSHEQALGMALRGKTYSEIAKHFGVSTSAISQMLSKETEAIRGYLAYIVDKDKHMEFLQWKLLDNLKPHQKGNVGDLTDYQRIMGVAILEDKIRLLRGQSTDNIDIRAATLSLDEINARRTELAAEIAEIKAQLLPAMIA